MSYAAMLQQILDTMCNSLANEFHHLPFPAHNGTGNFYIVSTLQQVQQTYLKMV